jgi:uncharacterized Ntn-hydrolase superfamily protein
MTYSIVARDPATGAMAVAVQSHAFRTGALVPWLEPGVGAVASQAFVQRAHGPRGLFHLQSGLDAASTLAELEREDEGWDLRQIGLVDRKGRVAIHTGSRCLEVTGAVMGEQFCVQGNMLRSQSVCQDLADAYCAASGSFASRLVSGLEAAEAAGGDARGRQSAGLVIVSGVRGDRPWEQMLVDLRVDDHPNPLAELRRLLAVDSAMKLSESKIPNAVKTGDRDALEGYLDQVRKAMPGNPEVMFWTAISLLHAGQLDPAVELFDEAIRSDAGWRDLLERLPKAGILSVDPSVVASLLQRLDH